MTMYNPHNVNSKDPVNPTSQIERIFESLSLDPMKDLPMNDQNKMFAEAVFSDGRSTVLPLVEKLQTIKDLLEEEITKQDNTSKAAEEASKKKKQGEQVKIPKVESFNPKAFWRNTLFKELEDLISKIFGFRNVEIHPYIERYNSKSKIFESRIMNCEIYHQDRYPIDGLVSDKGFYDKSKSLVMQVHMSLGLIRALSAEEILAVLLHEFGHSVDPALVDIKYIETNILSKYLTDRKNAINRSEKKFIDKHKVSATTCLLLIGIIGMGISKLIELIVRKIGGEEKYQEKKLNKIRKQIESDKDIFNRQNSSEAFADNFARMYGFGPQLATALKKMTAEQDGRIKSRYKKECQRQECILYITKCLIDDVHKTDIHRIRNLINEYKIDIADPNISATTKKQLEEDLTELEKVLDEYLHNFSEFQNRVNQVINEELSKVELPVSDQPKEKKSANDKREEAIKEGFTFFDETSEVFEEKHPLQEKMEKKCPLDKGDKSKIDNKFGKSRACSWAKDKDGYFCYTHRCRSKSYASIDDIPQKDVDFVRSTC